MLYQESTGIEAKVRDQKCGYGNPYKRRTLLGPRSPKANGQELRAAVELTASPQATKVPGKGFNV
jgi:hypothetical protein